jgi:hypothetical protein
VLLGWMEALSRLLSVRLRDPADTRWREFARVFPSRREFLSEVTEESRLPAKDFSFGPYATDLLTYKTKTIVEYRTPAKTEGLGTFPLAKSLEPIGGVALLVGPYGNLYHLAVRLPRAQEHLTRSIISQFERDAVKLP